MRWFDFKFLLLVVAAGIILEAPLNNTLFAYGGGEGGGSTSVSSGSPDRPPPGWDGENIDPIFRTPDFVKNPPEKKRDPWGAKKKPKHWTDKQWRSYKEKRNREWKLQEKEAHAEKDTANRNDIIARGAGLAATGAGAVVGAVAAPAIVPTIVAISIAGDGAAATFGSLAEGKDIKTALKDGVKKSISSKILSKVSTGKAGVDAAMGLFGGLGYDNIDTTSSGKGPSNQLPPPDFTTPGGHEIRK
jgi:hypothetical protein